MSKDFIIGDMMEVMNDDELQEVVRKVSIFSCIIPEHKMRIVKAFRDNSEIVVMTWIRCRRCFSIHHEQTW